MTSTGTHLVKSRDSARTKAALLAAARELFGLQGYTRTTTREIGEKAGVDPALIARYFGSKAALYVASLESDDGFLGRVSVEETTAHERVVSIIERVSRFGPSPVLQAAVARPDDPEIADAARRILAERIVAPFERRLSDAGADRVALRAELIAAALTGVVMARSAGTFATLSAASNDDITELTTAAIDRLLEP